MITLHKRGAYLVDGKRIVPAEAAQAASYSPLDGAKNTIAYQILAAHNRADADAGEYRLFFDALASHDITYVGIIQTARASGLEKFPLPYVLTNCHNSLCAVGGTINADDHAFGLSAAQKYGGIYVPPHMAVIHQYMREKMVQGGGMILGSDSHTRYGALGVMGFGEGGGELVKQLLGQGYDLPSPDVVGVYVTGKPPKGVGPQDIALSLIGAVFENGYVKNKVLEFVGEGISRLSVDFRNGIDVMTTETACLSSIWATDDAVEEFYTLHGRADCFKKLQPGPIAYYDGFIEIDLSQMKPMMALPYHPSRVFSIADVLQHGAELWPSEFRDKIVQNGLRMDQGIIAGCAGGTYENIAEAAAILDGQAVGSGLFGLNVYPASQPVQLALTENGIAARLMRAGVMIKTAFCGPCFGAGDVPCNQGLSIRHTTRNFPNREGSKPGAGQNAAVALMDARSIAATARNGGLLTAASDYAYDSHHPRYFFDGALYNRRVFSGQADETKPLVFGPGIKDWPPMEPLKQDLLMRVASFITDPVTTTDELIPSGETSSYRSNPEALAEFTLSRKDPGYVARAKAYRQKDESLFALLQKHFPAFDSSRANVGSLIYALKPGDGSAREQAASCQRVLGGLANIAVEYATKRYRSNLINWGLLPFVLKEEPPFTLEDIIYIPNIRQALEAGETEMTAYVVKNKPEAPTVSFIVSLPALTKEEAVIVLSGCLINQYQSHR